MITLIYRQLCSPNKSEDIQEISGETASNLVHPPLSIQTLYDNEFQNRYQGETAQSMFERLSRLFEESDVSNFYILFIPKSK
jgi:hypothetical protein